VYATLLEEIWVTRDKFQRRSV